MLLHAMMGLKRARGAGTPLYGALEPCWHPGRLDPCHVAAFEATFLGIQVRHVFPALSELPLPSGLYIKHHTARMP